MLELVNKEKLKENYIKWQREFVAGNQMTDFNMQLGEKYDIDKKYYFSSHESFNIMRNIVEGWVESNYENLWGMGEYVDQLIPYQKKYNQLMNNIIDMSDRLVAPTILVEDGSVDADELAEEGLAPGKIIIYRQGSTKCPIPLEITRADDISMLYGIAQAIKNEMFELANSLEIRMMKKDKKLIQGENN